MEKRFLNGGMMTEVVEARLNTSSEQVENNIGGFDNITFTKKVNGKGSCSANLLKTGYKEFCIENGFNVSQYIKDEKMVVAECNPIKYINEDMFGMMKAKTLEATKKEYEALPKEEQELYEKKKNEKVYKKNITVKREARLKLSSMVGLGVSKVKKEWNVCQCEGDSMPYVTEKYSDLMTGIFNLNVNEVGKFKISDNATKFRDYTCADKRENPEIVEELPRDERLARIKISLEAIRMTSCKSNQSNNLTDTKPKVIILGEYKWGNNMFQGLITKNGINVEGLKEVLDDYDDYRLSKIWIGINSNIMAESFNSDREQLQKELEGYDVEVTTVGKAFKGYVEHLEKTLV